MSNNKPVAQKTRTTEVAGKMYPQIQERNKRTCWHCNEPLVPGHNLRCKVKKALHVILMQGGDEEEDVLEEHELKKEQGFVTAPASPEESEVTPEDEQLMMISHHAVKGTTNHATFSLITSSGKRKAMILVDSGSTNSFMDYEFAVRSNCQLRYRPTKKVVVAGGGELCIDAVIETISYKIQGSIFENSFQILNLRSYDMILGTDWIYDHSPTGLDLKRRTLTINKGGRIVIFTDYTTPNKHYLVDFKLEKNMRKEVLGLLIQINLIQETDGQELKKLPQEILEILQQYANIFSEPRGLPPKRECDHSIPLKINTETPNIRPYRTPHHHRDAMEEIIKQLLESEEIRNSVCPYSSPTVMVRKKDGSWRMCVYYRQLNSMSIKNKFPMPIIEDLLDELHGAIIFSKLDLRSGYHQIRMVEEDIPKTAFKTHLGHYEYTAMPFGLTNAPATFQSLMNKIFALQLRKFVLVFFDDILIYSRNLTEHGEHLQLVLSILRKYQLAGKMSKCCCAMKEIGYLGRIISGTGVSTIPGR